MSSAVQPYDYIAVKIKSMKDMYPELRHKKDAYVFSALCVKSDFYKNPALVLDGSDFADIVVDSKSDGGVDILLSDPNSEGADLIIGQSKFYKTITYDDALSAMLKMVIFYKDMEQGKFEQVNSAVQSRFLSLNSEIGSESKICFVLYTSAPKSGIRKDRIEKKVREQFNEDINIDIRILFGADIVDEIKESESCRATVESGRISIDKSKNVLRYGEDAAIVNVSAYSIKELYALYNIDLLSRNLRYHVSGADIDRAIADTIDNDPESFWLKNNGITIICDDFEISGKEVKLKNFSIVNGGQTTFMLHKSSNIKKDRDLFLPCKVIRILGETEDEKNLFSLSIAKATNSQKAIKPADLKANSPEQVRFIKAMREVGIFYQTKRGEVVPKDFKEPFLNTALFDIGKLCLAGIFQQPCASRNKPSSVYLDKYYNPIFNGDQAQIASICKELLYIDYYFRNKFLKQFEHDNAQHPNSNVRLTFARNARTICLAFVSFVARYKQGNFKNEDLKPIFSSNMSDSVDEKLYETFSDVGNIQDLLPKNVFNNKATYETILSKLFTVIIDSGVACYNIVSQLDSTLTASNYLKKDKNYYRILASQWDSIMKEINKIFAEIGL